MSRTPIREYARLAARRQDFEGSSCRGKNLEWSWDGDPSKRTPRYVIFSYHTPIIVHTGGQWFVTDEKYSQATSRHFNACHVTGTRVDELTIKKLASGYSVVEVITERLGV